MPVVPVLPPGSGGKLKFRLNILFGVWQEGDFRNWHEIEKWAAGDA
ncbi:MAG TPA: hypothetical protein VMV74_12310 [Bacteroidales bacterium]|nr:hypothetical protein [Bacteroidales bacterium]